MFRVQGTLPNIAICPNIARKCYLQFYLFILHFSVIFLWISFPVSIFRYGPWTQPLQHHDNREYHLYVLGDFLLNIWSMCSMFLYLDINPEPWTQPLQPHGNIQEYSYFYVFFPDFLAIFPDFRDTVLCKGKIFPRCWKVNESMNQWINQWKICLSPQLIKNESYS